MAIKHHKADTFPRQLVVFNSKKIDGYALVSYFLSKGYC